MVLFICFAFYQFRLLDSTITRNITLCLHMISILIFTYLIRRKTIIVCGDITTLLLKGLLTCAVIAQTLILSILWARAISSTIPIDASVARASCFNGLTAGKLVLTVSKETFVTIAAWTFLTPIFAHFILSTYYWIWGRLLCLCWRSFLLRETRVWFCWW